MGQAQILHAVLCWMKDNHPPSASFQGVSKPKSSEGQEEMMPVVQKHTILVNIPLYSSLLSLLQIEAENMFQTKMVM